MTEAQEFAAGRAAYDGGIAWRSTMPSEWRRGWVNRQNEVGVERAAFLRHLRAEMKRPPLEGDF